jgi:predicted AAA+ superfamily ATPase
LWPWQGAAKKNDEQEYMSCKEFQEQLPELLSKSEEDVEHHPHLRSCELCRALIEDLHTIAEESRRRWPYENL